MLENFTIKRGDTIDTIAGQLDDSDGNPITDDLAGGTVAFNMMDSTGTVLIHRADGVILDAADRVVGYEWVLGDTDVSTVGADGVDRPNLAEFEFTFADGRRGTWPNSGFIKVHIPPDIRETGDPF